MAHMKRIFKSTWNWLSRHNPISILTSFSKRLGSIHRSRLYCSYVVSLPTEITLLVTEYLPLESSISFSLTCKAFKGSLFETCVQKADNATIERFLRLLERDLPALAYCRYCNQLVSWHRKPFGSPYNCRPTAPKHSLSLLLGRVPGLFEQQKDLILRADELGPAYGLSISCLRIAPRVRGPKEAKICYNAHIIGGRLVLRHVTRLSFALDDDFFKQAQELLDAVTFPDSSSLHLPGAVLCLVHALLSRCANADSDFWNKSVTSPLLHSEKCSVDMRLEVRWLEHAVQATVISYASLGPRNGDADAAELDMFPITEVDRNTNNKDIASNRDLEQCWLQYKKEDVARDEPQISLMNSDLANLEFNGSNIIDTPGEACFIQAWPTWYSSCSHKYIKAPEISATASTNAVLIPWISRWNDTVPHLDKRFVLNGWL